MGLTALQIEIGNPAIPGIPERLNLLLDSGILHAVVPSLVLERLGIKPTGELTVRLMDGTPIIRMKGVALFRYGAQVCAGDVVFGEAGDLTLMGTQTLAALGCFLHPLTRTLQPMRMMLA